MAVFETQWYFFPFDVESELVEIRARHYGIAQIDGYVKLFSDTSYPSTATFTITPASAGLATTVFPTNYIFHQSLIGVIYNAEAVRLVFTGGGVSAEQQFVSEISLVIQSKQERKNYG